MGYDLGYTSRNGYQANISRYNTNVANAGFNFGIPLNEFDRIGLDFDLKQTEIRTTQYSPLEIQQFIDKHNGKETFLTFSGGLGWTHDTLNKAIFASNGGQQRFSALATVPGSDLEYYKVGYKQQHYFPLSSDFTFRLLGEVAYGNGYSNTHELPFFENYYGGGPGSVRGFRQNTLGPRDTPDPKSTVAQTPRPFGGATKILGSAELFFPVPFLSDVKSVRIGTFMDAGSISDGLNFNGMRYAAGLSGEWLSPFGAISVSVAQPFNASSTDNVQNFQFNFGSGF
jgi:outer membrane protein insertion porin family